MSFDIVEGQSVLLFYETKERGNSPFVLFIDCPLFDTQISTDPLDLLKQELQPKAVGPHENHS